MPDLSHKILVVSLDTDFIEALRSQLSRHGFLILHEPSVLNAVGCAADEHPDIILCDSLSRRQPVSLFTILKHHTIIPSYHAIALFHDRELEIALIEVGVVTLFQENRIKIRSDRGTKFNLDVIEKVSLNLVRSVTVLRYLEQMKTIVRTEFEDLMSAPNAIREIRILQQMIEQIFKTETISRDHLIAELRQNLVLEQAHVKLTDREKRVFRELSQAFYNASEIGERLGMNSSNVRQILQTLRAKFNLSSTQELLKFAVKVRGNYK